VTSLLQKYGRALLVSLTCISIMALMYHTEKTLKSARSTLQVLQDLHTANERMMASKDRTIELQDRLIQEQRKVLARQDKAIQESCPGLLPPLKLAR
jgi:hypothetical protein